MIRDEPYSPNMRLLFIAILVAHLASCSSSSGYAVSCSATCLANRAAAAAIVGTWAQTHAWNGTSVQMSLTAHDTSISGVATLTSSSGSVRAARIGGFVSWRAAFPAPSGYVVPAQPITALTIASDGGRTVRLDQATLVSPDSLVGVLTFSNEPFRSYGVAFLRVKRR